MHMKSKDELLISAYTCIHPSLPLMLSDKARSCVSSKTHPCCPHPPPKCAKSNHSITQTTLIVLLPKHWERKILWKKLLFVLPCLASLPFHHFYPSLQSNKTSIVRTSFFLLQGTFVLPSLFSFLLIVFIYFFLHVFHSSSLFYISFFSYSLVSSLSPPRTHTHRLQTT